MDFPLSDNNNNNNEKLDMKISRQILKKKKIQNQLLLDSLIKFYKKKSNVKIITNIVTGNSNISLRLIDWFSTNYSKKCSIYLLNKNKQGVNVYTDYRSQLKAYSKQLFDPFRRRERINFYFDEDNFLETTTGQLNFFRWAIELNILIYIENNLNVIEKDMISSQKLNQEKKNDKNNLKIKVTKNDKGNEIITTRKKRNELSKSKCKNITYNINKRLITFD
jgi:hypothetical protein